MPGTLPYAGYAAGLTKRGCVRTAKARHRRAASRPRHPVALESRLFLLEWAGVDAP